MEAGIRNRERYTINCGVDDMKNVLVIGGAGFLGTNLTYRCLQEPDVSVTVLDSLDPHMHSSIQNLKKIWQKIKFVRGDIRDETLLAELVQDKDIIFNCAAQTSHPLSIQFPLLDVDINCMGNLKLLEAVRLVNKEAILVYTSSSTVIGKATEKIIDENHGEKPLEIYSANKGVAEKYYRIYHTIHDLKTIVLRFANLYGPYGKGLSEFGFVNYFISLAWKNEEIKIFGAGQQMRNVLFVDDATEILWRVAHEPKLCGDTFFAVSEEHLTVSEISQKIVSVLGRGKVTHIEWPEVRKRMEVEGVMFSSAKLRKALDWKPNSSFEEGLEKTRKSLEQV
jgi:UDP-glucose 4-epimerase